MPRERLDIFNLWMGGVVAALACAPVPAAPPAPAAGASLATRSPVPGAPAGVTAFVGVNVVPMDTERVLPNHTVLVRHGWITALGPSAQVPVPAGATRIEGRGQYLIPGLVDMHMDQSPGTHDTLLLERILRHELAMGITTVRSMGHMPLTDPVILRLRARAAAGTLLSPRIYTSGPWYPWPGRPADASDVEKVAAYVATIPPERVATYLATYKAKGYDFIKPYFETPEIFDSLLTIGHRLGLPAAGHIPRVTNRINYRVGTVQHEVQLEQALAGRMSSIEHLGGHKGGYTSYLRRKHLPDYHPDSARQVLDTTQLDAMRPTIAALAAETRRAEVWNCPTFLGMNHPVFNLIIKTLQDSGAGLLMGIHGLVTPSTELQSFVQAGLTPYQALLTGTRNPAQYFGTLDSSGTVAVGKRADLVLVAGNPLVDVSHVGELAGVMLGGRWLPITQLQQHRQGVTR